MKKRCIVCGKKLNIILNKDKTYKGGYYFGKMRVQIGKGKLVKVGTTKLLGKKIDIVKWTGKSKKAEYWECKKCFNEE
ncbi:MAG: hypothetical protein Q7J54_03590 [Candidatus Woesearchaeota archaeon]|nr:hypothetical protein [Candidatus Woesearchaeota archaeon]